MDAVIAAVTSRRETSVRRALLLCCIRRVTRVKQTETKRNEASKLLTCLETMALDNNGDHYGHHLLIVVFF